VADVFKAAAVLGAVEPPVLDFPTALGRPIQDPAADLRGREIRALAGRPWILSVQVFDSSVLMREPY